MTHRKSFIVNDDISFVLPDSFVILEGINDSGEQVFTLATNRYTADTGETDYHFKLTIGCSVEDAEFNDNDNPFFLLDKTASNPQARTLRTTQAPIVQFLTLKTPISLFGRGLLKFYGRGIQIPTPSGQTYFLSNARALSEDSDETLTDFQNLLNAARTIRVNGQALDLSGITAEKLMTSLLPVFDDADSSAPMFNVKMKINGIEVDDTTDDGEDDFPIALLLDDELHEHFDLSESPAYTTNPDADFVGQPIRMLMKKCGNQYMEEYSDLAKTEYYDEHEKAIELAKVFRLHKNLFDPFKDTEALIRRGMFAKARMFSALRSLAWTVGEIADGASRELDDFSFEELEKIGEFIEEQEYLNYNDFQNFQGLCGHPDWHVFYIPDDFASAYDMRFLCGKENRGGNTSFLFIPGLTSFDSTNRINEIISRNEEYCASLYDLRSDLIELEPVMQTIHDGFMQNRDRSKQLEGPHADALIAWCALCVAAKEPFYSEEAVDTPEADASLTEPLTRPTDALPGSETDNAGAAAKKNTFSSGAVLNVKGKSIIEAGQFMQDLSLRNIVIPEGVTEISDNAFSYCMNLESVAFPKSLRKIGESAFSGCRSLNRVEFQDGILELGDFVFGACSSLKRVELPDSLQKVERCVFGLGGDNPYATAYLSGETARRLGDIYARHLVIDGIGYDSIREYLSKTDRSSAFDEDKDEDDSTDWMDQYSDYISRRPDIQFKDRLFVFSGLRLECSDEKSHPLVQKVIELGGQYRKGVSGKTDYLVISPEYAGEYKIKSAIEQIKKGGKIQIIHIDQLTEAILQPEVHQESTVASKAVNHTKPVKEDSLPARNESHRTSSENAQKKTCSDSIPSNALQADSDTTASVSPVQSSLHAYASTSEEASAYVTHVHQAEEEINSTLEQIPGGHEGWSFEIVNGCLESVSVKKYANPNLILPENITSISSTFEFDFSARKVLHSITMPCSITSINSPMFKRCENLKKAILPDGVRQLPEDFFSDCTALEYVSLPRSLTGIPEHCFQNCHHLQKIVIPDSVIVIENRAFKKCCSLVKIIFPKSLKKIGNHALLDCSALEEAVLPMGLTEIGEFAFSNCHQLKRLIVPNSVHTIGKHAFPRHPSLTIYASASNTAVQSAAKDADISVCTGPVQRQSDTEDTELFRQFNDLVQAEQTTPSSPPAAPLNGSFEANGWSLRINRGKLSDITATDHAQPILVLPAGITLIADSLNGKKQTPQGIIISEGVTEIDAYAFYECASLRYVHLPESLVNIGISAFNNCIRLSRINFPSSLRTLGENAFTYCTSLTELTLPESLTEIGENVFVGCFGLTTVALPAELTEIPTGIFSECVNLANITFPRRLKRIKEYAFKECLSLKNLILPNGLEYIDKSAFSFCHLLSSAYIPDSIKCVDQYAFPVNTELISPAVNKPENINSISPEEANNLLAEHAAFVQSCRDFVMQTLLEEQRKEQERRLREEQEKLRLEEEHRQQKIRLLEEEQSKRLEQARREQELQEQRRKEREERQRLEQRRKELSANIERLTKERDSLKGLFSFMKRKKLQEEIDACQNELNRLR